MFLQPTRADRLQAGVKARDCPEEVTGGQIDVPSSAAEEVERLPELRAKSSRTRPWLVVVVLLVHGGLLAWIDLQTSPTRNELAHLVAGLLVWEFGDFSAYSVNPPLPRAIASIPAACRGLEPDDPRLR